MWKIGPGTSNRNRLGEKPQAPSTQKVSEKQETARELPLKAPSTNHQAPSTQKVIEKQANRQRTTPKTTMHQSPITNNQKNAPINCKSPENHPYRFQSLFPTIHSAHFSNI